LIGNNSSHSRFTNLLFDNYELLYWPCSIFCIGTHLLTKFVVKCLFLTLPHVNEISTLFDISKVLKTCCFLSSKFLVPFVLGEGVVPEPEDEVEENQEGENGRGGCLLISKPE
jgi:hypothetical protein